MDKLSETCCPHCSEPMLKWANPQLGSWSGEYHYVCFNDQCSYFVNGWRWMSEQFNVTASYRYSFDPSTGERGPLPVWSKEALRCNIFNSEPGGPNHD